MSVRTRYALVAVLSLVSGPSARAAGDRPDAYVQARNRMVDEFIAPEGVKNERVLQSMRDTPRHEFVRASDVKYAYNDAAMAIGFGQTISPPFIVAYMTETIDPQPTDTVLEIGTGSGYQAAVLSPLVKDVYTIEIVEPLAKQAEKRMAKLHYDNVHVKFGDGYQGWPEHAPFDKIIVTCSPEKVPAPLVEQLAEGGKLLIPLGERYQQVFYLFEKKNGKLGASKLIPALFVPMTGESEAKRQIKPDPLHPQIVNGGFEDDADEDGLADGWHYQRQTKLSGEGAAAGQRSLAITNTEPGHLAQALQGFAVDGRKIAALNVAASFRAKDIRPGPNRDEQPGLVLLFYDQDRKTIGAAHIAPPVDSDGWASRTKSVPVPTAARESIIAATLAGGTGELDVDDVSVTGVAR